MMQIKEIRLQNARLLCDKAGGLKNFCERVNREYKYIQNLIGKTPQKGIGDSMAVVIEDSFGLERGWLDTPHFPREVKSVLFSIPVLNWDQAAFYEKYLNKPSFYLPVTSDCSKQSFAVGVLEPSKDFSLGEFLIVDPKKDPKPGDYILAKKGSQAVLRAFMMDGDKVYLEPINPHLPVDSLSGLTILGTVAFKFARPSKRRVNIA